MEQFDEVLPSARGLPRGDAGIHGFRSLGLLLQPRSWRPLLSAGSSEEDHSPPKLFSSQVMFLASVTFHGTDLLLGPRLAAKQAGSAVAGRAALARYNPHCDRESADRWWTSRGLCYNSIKGFSFFIIVKTRKGVDLLLELNANSTKDGKGK